MSGEGGRRVGGSCPASEQTPISTKMLAEGDIDDDIDITDG
jgi:hypothetical protein